jgi:hypothetical protein
MLCTVSLILGSLIAPPGDEVARVALKDKVELFAAEDWYKSQAGKEEWFEGTLQHFPLPEGTATIGRYNAYRLKMDKDTREVYVGAQGKLLLPYVNKQIKLQGKAVELEVVGKVHREIWPARLEVVKAAPKPGAAFVPAPAPANNAKPNEEFKIAARAPLGGAINVQGRDDGKQIVIRTEEDFKKAFPNLEQVKKSLKVESIDFTKQMLIHVTAGSRPTGGYRVNITKVQTDDTGKTLNVNYTVQAPMGFATQAFTHPGELVLVDRFEGDVKFTGATTAPKVKPVPRPGVIID